MSKFAKILLILAGYIIAYVAASVAVDIRVLNTQGPAAQASAGMNAFGDAICFIVVFVLVALIPTGLGLFYLRRARKFWTAFSVISLAFACTGLAAALWYAMARNIPLENRSFSTLLAGLSPVRLLLSPLPAIAFIIFAFISPTRLARRVLLGAAAIEMMVGAYFFYHMIASHYL